MPGLLMKYFVLKPKGADRYAEASRQAMGFYAAVINDENPELADALREWVTTETKRARAAGCPEPELNLP